MPLPVLSPSNTERYRVKYQVGDLEHVFQVRAVGPSSPASLGTFVDALLDAMSPDMWALTITSVEFAALGSDIFLPVSSGIEGSAYGSGVIGGFRGPQFVAFQGRSTGGRKVRLSLYGFKFDTNDYRVNAGEKASVDAAIAVLNAATNYACAIDGVLPNWYNYANTGFNAYWQRELRG